HAGAIRSLGNQPEQVPATRAGSSIRFLAEYPTVVGAAPFPKRQQRIAFDPGTPPFQCAPGPIISGKPRPPDGLNMVYNLPCGVASQRPLVTSPILVPVVAKVTI